MKKYPFKFLDAYDRDDKGIFFGRDEEIDELYEMVFQSSVILVYGASGTGKTSLINCGLAGRFQPHDWLPLMIRRGANINDSLEKILIDAGGKKVLAEIDSYLFKDREEDIEAAMLNPVCSSLKAVYEKYFRPVYLIFDQFEELFILGASIELQIFIQTVQDILQSAQPVKLIFSIREEYLGYLFDFEKSLPQLFKKKLRVEAMNLSKVKQVIIGVSEYEYSNVTIKSGEADEVAEGIFDKIRGKGKTLTIQLPFLQVFLDKFYLKITGDETRVADAEFSMSELNGMEEIDDVLIDFLEEQVYGISEKLKAGHPVLTVEMTWKILSPFSTLEGTKEPISKQSLYERLPGVDVLMINNIIDAFSHCRILRFNEGSEMFEIAHDCLARPIAEKRSVEEKSILEIKRLISSQVAVKEEAREHFTEKQLIFIEPYLEKFKPNDEEQHWISKSRQKIIDQKRFESEKQQLELANTRKRLRNVRGLLFLAIIAIIAAVFFNTSANKQKRLAEEQKQKAIRHADSANFQKARAENQREAAIRSEMDAELQKAKADSSAFEAEKEKKNAIRSAIDAGKQKRLAEVEKDMALQNKKLADSLKLKAEESAKEAVREKQNAEASAQEATRLKEVAEKQTLRANISLQRFEDLKKTAIGAKHGGGIVFYTDSTGVHGLIAAENDLGKFSWKKAKDTCEKLVLNGYDDWQMPSRTELAVLFANKDFVSGFTPTYYWSATEAGFAKSHGWTQMFTTGFQTGKGKRNEFLIRPVRKF